MKLMEVRRNRCQFPEKVKPLLTEDYRFGVLYGGRGSGKSHSMGRILLLEGAQEKLRILCGREIQLSIKDSVHTLLCDLVHEMKMEDEYDILATEIRHKYTGTTINYSGLHHNIIAKVKSMEAIDRLFVEEGQTMSEASWRVLLPTIRKKGSRVLVAFNPDLEEDPTYQRFVVNPPPDCISIEMNFSDNPFFKDTEMESERVYTQINYPKDYDNIWLGKPRTLAEGAVFGDEMDKAYDEGRVGTFDYDPTEPVYVAFDIGVDDPTAVWFGQRVKNSSRMRLIDHEEMRDQGAPQFVKMLREKPYIYGGFFSPHDGAAREWGSGGLSPNEILLSHGITPSPVKIMRIKDRLHAGRMFIAHCEFDKERCKDGLLSLRNYKWDIHNRTKERREKPKHDWASHSADAFTYFAVSAAQMHTFVSTDNMFDNLETDFA
jgi:phage terminase large subunit